MKAVTKEEMSNIDISAQQDYGMMQEVLMENAGRAAFEEIKKDVTSLEGKDIIMLAGKGNNAGDGFVLARHLYNAGASPVIFAAEEKIRPGAASSNFLTIQKMGIKVFSHKLFLEEEKYHNREFYVDALFGIGFRGELPEVLQEISKIVRSPSKVYSLDIPSGLDATSGEASSNCFAAYKTISFGLPKAGFYRKSGPRTCGKVINKDIGFPRQLLEPYL